MSSSRRDIIVIAAATAKAGQEAELEAALREAAGPTRTQPGCVQFGLYRRSESPTTIIGFERWASEEDHQRHLRGAHIERLIGRMREILAEPPNIVSYEVIDE